jgi:hypothetical protein
MDAQTRSLRRRAAAIGGGVSRPSEILRRLIVLGHVSCWPVMVMAMWCRREDYFGTHHTGSRLGVS